ncbi:Hsp20/alpha crystallin family protein [Micromonospora echinofusca]|uniref:Hsp20 family protein n=1 Tax=Micromonospora echinofusca TaxID=47858 RepID=A0ABS3VSW1_MICEH|nr:Hsp20/alpha crystallin family protein [Micromonospora echinofusca]MBO4207610.1 Hsp20 family protein [Micromonospora echinofusca]
MNGQPPEVELTETSHGWTVLVRLPGVAPEEVALELDDRELCVRGRSEAEVNADQGIAGGMRARAFEHRIALPSPVDPDRIDAVMDHGLLRVTLPRAARPARRTITIGRMQPGPTATPGSVPTRGADGRPPLGTGQRAGHAVVGAVGGADPAADRELHHPDVVTGGPDRSQRD